MKVREFATHPPTARRKVWCPPVSHFHIGEVYDSGNAVLILMYLPGSEAKRAQMKRSRFTSSQEREKDRPDDFFDSFRRVD